MNLSRLEKQVLRFIDKHFLTAWERTNAEEIRTKQERPLATLTELMTAFPKYPKKQLEAAVNRLVALECVKEVYLWAKGDFTEIRPGAGKTTRMPVAHRGEGENGYQVTAFGKETLAGLWKFKSQGAARAVGGKVR